jgi:hypothetical protein
MFKITNKTRKHTSQKCCHIDDIAYKRVVIYVWLPKVKSMFAQIIMDCQTKKETVSCDYCIVKENCYLRLELGEKIVKKELTTLLVPLLLVRV